MSHSLKCLVIQVDMRYLDVRIFDRVYVYTKAVILGRDFHLSCQEIHYRMVGPPMAELQFKGLSAKGKAQELLTQAYAKDGIFAEQVLNGVNGIGNGLRVSGPVGKQDPIGI